MPLYDCVLLLKPHVRKESSIDLVSRIGKHVYARNGVVTEVKSFGNVQLGYGVKKLDGRFYEGQLMQMTMMATPNMNKELHYLNKEDRLLRWILVKHRDTTAWMNDPVGPNLSQFSRRNFWDVEIDKDEDDDSADDDDDNVVDDGDDDDDDDGDDDDDDDDVDEDN